MDPIVLKGGLISISKIQILMRQRAIIQRGLNILKEAVINQSFKRVKLHLNKKERAQPFQDRARIREIQGALILAAVSDVLED